MYIEYMYFYKYNDKLFNLAKKDKDNANYLIFLI